MIFKLRRILSTSLLCLALAVLSAAPVLSEPGVAGNWVGKLTRHDAPGGPRTSVFRLSLNVRGDKVSGTAGSGDQANKIAGGKVVGNEVSFFILVESREIDRFLFRGVVDGDEMKLTMNAKRADTGDEVKLAEGVLLRAD